MRSSAPKDLALLVALLAAACAPERTRPSAVPNAAMLSLLPDTLSVFQGSAGEDVEVARVIQSFRRTTLDGRPVIEQVFVQSSARYGDAVDSLWLADPSLSPLRHHRHGGPMPMAIDYAGSHVHGSATGSDGALQVVDVDLGEPVFDAAASDLVVRALSLRSGLRADLPMYAPVFDGIRRLIVQDVSDQTCRVRGGGMHPCWVVTTDFGGVPTTMKISRDARALLEVDDPTTRYVR